MEQLINKSVILTNETIEIVPGYSVLGCKVLYELTESGLHFLKELARQFCSGAIDEHQVLDRVNGCSNDFEEREKLMNELYKMLL